MITRWVSAPGVVSCSEGDITVLLSLHDGRYYTMNELGGKIWAQLCHGDDVDGIVRLIAEITEVPRDALRSDVEAFVSDLRNRRLIQSAECRRPSGSAPCLLKCFVTLAAIHLGLRVVGPGRVLSWIHRLTSRAKEVEPLPGWCAETARNITAAAAWYPFAAQCFEQSLCFLVHARRAGIDAVLRMGVLPCPLMAHAWVEYHGVPLNDTAEQLKLYRQFPAFDSRAL